MLDISNITLVDLVETAKTGAWLVFYATWLSITLEHLRHPKNIADYSPYAQKVSAWVIALNPLQMQTLSLVTFFVPVAIVALLLYYVPTEWWVVAEPVFRWLVLAVAAYSAQQYIHLKTR